jgi:hypothetical protein
MSSRSLLVNYSGHLLLDGIHSFDSNSLRFQHFTPGGIITGSQGLAENGGKDNRICEWRKIVQLFMKIFALCKTERKGTKGFKISNVAAIKRK